MNTHAFKVSPFSSLMEINKIINPWKPVERRGEMTSCQGSKIFWTWTNVFDRDSHLHCRMMGYRFVSECIKLNIIFFFFCFFVSFLPYLPRIVEIQKFCCHGNVTQQLLFSIKTGEIIYHDTADTRHEHK